MAAPLLAATLALTTSPQLLWRAITVRNRSRPQASEAVVDVVGNVCESGDIFARDRSIPLPALNDVLSIGFAGAYGEHGSTYNLRPLPAEVVIEAGNDWYDSPDYYRPDHGIRGRTRMSESSAPGTEAPPAESPTEGIPEVIDEPQTKAEGPSAMARPLETAAYLNKLMAMSIHGLAPISAHRCDSAVDYRDVGGSQNRPTSDWFNGSQNQNQVGRRYL